MTSDFEGRSDLNKKDYLTKITRYHQSSVDLFIFKFTLPNYTK